MVNTDDVQNNIPITTLDGTGILRAPCKDTWRRETVGKRSIAAVFKYVYTLDILGAFWVIYQLADTICHAETHAVHVRGPRGH